MKIDELIKSVNFHDSNVIELLFEGDKVRVTIDLCMWKQSEYKEGEDEIKNTILEFDKVTDYVWDSEKMESEIDYDTILEMSYKDEILKMVLYDEEVSIITFKSENVTVIH